jgi:hypothetical protein
MTCTGLPSFLNLRGFVDCFRCGFDSPLLMSLLQGTTFTPRLPACATMLFTMPSNGAPLSLVSECLIFAISHTCFKLTSPTDPVSAIPGAALWLNEALPLPSAPSLLFGPATLPAPRTLFFVAFTPAAARRSCAVGGVRISKWKLRSGRTVTRAGTGVPAM